MDRGKLIAIYGCNNLGKTTQGKLLVGALQNARISARYMKVPEYGLAPTGPIIWDHIKGTDKYKLDPLPAQMLYVQNRIDYQPQLERDLDAGISVIVEDYIGTGIAYGVAKGCNKELLLKLNSGLLVADINILLYGRRFMQSIERNHKHEQDDELMRRVADIHDELSDEFRWNRVYANDIIRDVGINIWNIVFPCFNKER